MTASEVIAAVRTQAGTLLFAAWGAEIAATLSGIDAFGIVGQVCVCLFLLLALFRVSRGLLIACGVLAVAAAAIVLRWHHLEGLEKGLQASLAFAGFFAALQFLRNLAEREPKVRYVRRAAGRAGPGAVQMSLLLAGQLVGAVFAAGAVFLLASMTTRSADVEQRVANALNALRGLGMTVAWSPFFVAMALVLSLTPGAELWQLIVLGLPPALVLLAVAVFAISRRHAIDYRRVWEVLAPVQKIAIPLVAIVAVATSLTGLSNLTVVALLVPCVAAVVRLRRPGIGMWQIASRTQVSLSRLNEEVLLVSVALILGQVAIASPELAQFLTGDHMPELPLLAYLALSAGLVFLGGFLGLHPLLTVSISLPLLHGIATGICSPVLLSAAALVGWAATNTISIWAVPVLLASNAFEVPTNRLSRGPNLAFATGYIVVGIAFLFAIAGLDLF
jgi:hypothetical protein